MMRGEDRLNRLHANTRIPKVVGLAREYELTSEQAYRTAAETFWDRPVILALKHRHPYRCNNPRVRINGEAEDLASVPTSYITIDRTWHDGETVELRLPMALHLVSLPHSDEKIVAVMYGPTVLAAVVPDEPGITNRLDNASASTSMLEVRPTRFPRYSSRRAPLMCSRICSLLARHSPSSAARGSCQTR